MRKQHLLATIRSMTCAIMAGILIAGCQTSPLTTDYAMAPTLSKTSNSTVYPNSAVPLKLEVKTAIPGEVDVEFIESKLSGVLTVEKQTIRLGESFKHDFAEPLYMTFTPSSYGDAVLRFTIHNERTTTDAQITFQVKQPAYTLAMLADTLVTVGVREELAFAIHELQTKAAGSGQAGGSKYTVSAQITKGKGVLQVKDKVLVDDSQTKVETKGKEPEGIDITKDQETPFYYTSLTEGENNIDFSVSDEFGNTVVTPVKLKAQNPMADFRISLKEDSVYKAAVLHDFSIVPSAQQIDRKFKMSWTIDPKSEVKDIAITSRAIPVLPGDQVDLKANTANPFGIITQTIGKMGVAFQFEDEYGSKYDTTVMLNIISPSIDFAFPETFPSQSEWKPIEWVGDLSAEAGTNAYQIKFECEDPNSGELTINGIVPIHGEKTDLRSGKNIFKYVPKETGSHKLLFTIYDKFGNEKTYPVTFTVGANKLGITVANVPQVNYGQSVNVNVNVPAQDHIKAFKGIVSSLDGGAATIEVNGTKVTENKEFDLKSGTNVFKVQPTKIAEEYKFKLLVKSDIGQEEEHEVAIPITLPALNAEVKTIVGKCDLTETLIYELTVNEAHYTGQFTLSPSIIQGKDGTISIAGKTIANNQTTTIDRSGTIPVVYTPKESGKGTVEFTIRITDENGQEKTVTLSGEVSIPALTCSTSATGQTIKYKTSTPFTLTIREALHPENFSIIPSFSEGSGVLKLQTAKEEKVLSPGVKFDLAAGTHNLTYTPNDCGTTDIQFRITDKHGKPAEAHALFTVEPYPLSFSMDNVSASEVNVSVPVTGTLHIDEQEAPENPYNLTFTATNKGTLKINNAVFGAGTSKSLSKGVHQLSYTPTATGSHRVVLTLRDMFGQEKTVTLNVEAKNAPLEASASVGSLSTQIKKAASFTISANEANYSDVFKVTATRTGEGTLTANGTTVAFGQEFNLAGGNTTMAYTPNTLGDHTLSFTVKDIYGQSKEFAVKIKADYATMTATATGPASMYVGRGATIALSLAEDNYTSNFTTVFSGGTGVLKNGTTIWNSGTGYSIAGGSTNLTYTPTSTGAHTLNFTFTDSYGQSKQSSVTINVTQAPLTVSATPASATIYTNTTATSTLAISEAEHPGQFAVRATTSGSGTMTINGSTVGNGSSINVNGGNSSIGYTPTSSGTHTVTFNVSDTHGQSKTTTFTVNASEPEIEASVTSPWTYKAKPVEIVLNLDKPNYTSTFTTSIQKSGSGTLTLSGGGNASTLTLGKGATRFTYTPNSTGTHTLTFKIQANDGKTKTLVSTIDVTESPITLNATPEYAYVQASESEGGKYTDIQLYAGRPYYSGNLKLSLEKITSDQSYELNNSVTLRLREVMVNNDLRNNYIGEFSGINVGGGDLGGNHSPQYNWTTTVTNGGNNGKTMSITVRCYGIYHPSAPGNTNKRFTLHFKATDDNGQSKTITTVVSIDL